MPTYLTRGLQKFKKFNFHDGFLRADLGRAKNCCQIGWIGCPIFQVVQKATVKFQFLAYFCPESPHQVNMKNVVKWWKDFFVVFNHSRNIPCKQTQFFEKFVENS